MSKLNLRFKPTAEDDLAVSRAATFNKATIVLLIIMALVSLGTLLAIAVGWLNPAGDLLFFYLLPPITFIIFIVYTPIRLRQQAKEVAARNQESRWKITSEGITLEGVDQAEERSWKSFAHVQELPDQFILFYAANRSEYIYLPKSAFKTPEQEETFRSLVEAHLGAIRS
ncbi:YcxB family protein [bacterium]|nr:YcxB family protein [bacterium]